MDRLSEYVIEHSACSMPRCEYVENDIEIDCYRCKEIMIEEHDAKVRADAIDEYIKIVEFYENEYDGIFWACRELKELKEQKK